MAEIELINLTKRWGSFVAVDNFNLFSCVLAAQQS